MLISPDSTVHESAVTVGYPATNNEAEYEAIIAGLQLAIRMGARAVHVFSDSQLVVGHLKQEYQAKDPRMSGYIEKVKELCEQLDRVEVEWVGREHNAHADALASLASAYNAAGTRSLQFWEVSRPSIIMNVEADQIPRVGESRLDAVEKYLISGDLPSDKGEAHRVRCQASNFYLDEHGDLYKRG